MYCKNCGNTLDDKAVVCPHCGVATGVPLSAQQSEQSPAATGATQSNAIGITGFVLSVVAAFFEFIAFFIDSPGASLLFLIIISGLSVAGLVCSIKGYQSAKYGASQKGLSLAGIIISSVVLGILVILWILALVLVAAILGA